MSVPRLYEGCAAPFSALQSIVKKGHFIRNILFRNGIGECIHKNARLAALSADTSTLQQAIDLWRGEAPYSFKTTHKNFEEPVLSRILFIVNGLRKCKKSTHVVGYKRFTFSKQQTLPRKLW
jgi:hypothetical protein